MTLKGIAYHIGFSASLLRVEVFFFFLFALWLIGVLIIGLWNNLLYIYIHITRKYFIPYIIQPSRVKLITANRWALRLLGSLRINPWNNSALCATFQRALDMARETQVLAQKSGQMIGEQQMFASHSAFFFMKRVMKKWWRIHELNCVFEYLCEIQVVQIRLHMTFVLMLWVYLII